MKEKLKKSISDLVLGAAKVGCESTSVVFTYEPKLPKMLAKESKSED